MDERTTHDAPRPPRAKTSGNPRPGMVVVWSGGAPALSALPVVAAPLVLGRGFLSTATATAKAKAAEDLRMSRRHVEISRQKERWLVRDLDSRNGTFVDGQPLSGEKLLEAPRTLRVGSTLLSFREDVRDFERARVEVAEGVVIGPRLRPAWEAIARDRKGGILHVAGETGSGKELAARHFHGGRGPFVAVNCASIPAALAERLLFGAKKGAYSDAVDAEGYVQSAQGGTLFLDEVAELPLELQAKLLRVVESREVVPLGATRGQRVEVRICSATHRDLRALVEAGKFRRDLYHRLGQPFVELPPLRAWPEEIGWILASLVAAPLTVDVTVVEAALLRPWPGNVRELAMAVGSAVRAAEDVVDARHLPESAGRQVAAAPAGDGRKRNPGKQAIVEALRASDGNISAAARNLGTSRTQLRRWMQHHGLDE